MWFDIARRLITIAAIALAGFLAGVSATKLVKDRQIANLRAEHAAMRAAQEAAASKALADAQQRAAEVEARLSKVEAQYVKALQAKDRAIAALDAAGTSLRQQLAAYTAGGGGESAGCEATVRDLQNRVTTLGVLVGRFDAFAERSARAADDTADELRLCRAYVEEVSR